MSGHPSSRQEAVSPAEPDSIYHLAHEWGSVDTVGNAGSQSDAGFSNARHWNPSAGDLDDMDDADMDDDDDDGEEEDRDDDEYDDDDEDDRFDNDDSDGDGRNVELQFSVYPAQGDTTAATAAGPSGEGQPQNPERVRSMGSNISLAWNLQISFPFGLLIGLLLVTTAQLFRLIGATELHRILQGHGVLRSRSNENGQGYDIYGVQATRRTRRTGPSRYPKPPSQTGRELMISGDYGSNPYYVDRLKGRKKKLATSLMYRELGAGSRGTEIRSSRELSQVRDYYFT